MKYCSQCKKIYEDNQECECVNEKKYSWEKQVTMIPLEIEDVCKKCGSKENLRYHPSYKYNNKHLEDDPAYCTCHECDEKARIAYEREEAMKYLILTPDEDEFLESKKEVEEYLNNLVSDMDYEDTLEGYLILKLDLVTGEIKADDFKKPNNTHLVFWDYDAYRVEEVIEPTVEFDGNINIIW